VGSCSDLLKFRAFKIKVISNCHPQYDTCSPFPLFFLFFFLFFEEKMKSFIDQRKAQNKPPYRCTQDTSNQVNTPPEPKKLRPLQTEILQIKKHSQTEWYIYDDIILIFRGSRSHILCKKQWLGWSAQSTLPKEPTPTNQPLRINIEGTNNSTISSKD
jgi:hypothetical protein